MKLFIGIDVGKSKLDIHFNHKNIQVINSPAGIKKLIKLLEKEKSKGFAIELVVCEATGGYEENLVTLLAEANYPIHVAHPNKARDFAKSQGKLAKTDRIDAETLSNYGSTFNLLPNYQPLSIEQAHLQALLLRRRQLIDEKVRESNRLDKPLTKFFRDSIKTHVKWLEKEIARIDQELKDHINGNKSLQDSVELLKSIPGVGSLTATIIISSLPEMGQIEDKQLSALVGVAPMNHDSGKYNGKRQIKGGRAAVREVLYMAAIASIRCNSVIKIYYHRLRAKGKPAKVAIVAAMHKLLLIINSVYKRQTPWIENLSKGLT